MAPPVTGIPHPSRPNPLRTDGSNPFARRSMEKRVPSLLLSTVDRNADYPVRVKDALRRLVDAIRSDRSLPLLEIPAPDWELWSAPTAMRADETWLNTEWFFSEMLAYRLAVEAVRFWDTSRDPFAPFKQEELDSPGLWELLDRSQNQSGGAEEQIAELLLLALWGNRIDLSVGTSRAQGTAASDSHLLTNHVAAAVEHLAASPGGTVHLVADNAGTEQAADLALVDCLLATGWAQTVVCHLKMMPVLVSDALVVDTRALIDRMASRRGSARNLAVRLSTYLEQGRLRLCPDFFWNTAGRLDELPARLRNAFAGSRLVISKGDANYRRVSNDALWPAGFALSRALPGFPAPLLLLRTLKSDTLLEVPVETYRRLDRAEPDWRTTGAYGVAQFAAF